jgi:hypothetical protein
MRINTIKPLLKPIAIEGGLTEFYSNLKKHYPSKQDLTYVKDTPCALGCMSIIGKLIKILTLQPGSLSNTKPILFARTSLNISILEPIIQKYNLDWTIKVNNVKTDVNAVNAVSLYNINRKLSNLVAYDLTIDDKVFDNYIHYINQELDYLDSIILKHGNVKNSRAFDIDEKPSNTIIIENNKRREQVRRVLNEDRNEYKNEDINENEPNLPDE